MKRRGVLAALGLGAFCRSGLAAGLPSVTSRAAVVTLPAGALYHEISLSDGVDFRIVQFNQRQTELRILDQPEESTARNLRTVMREAGAIAGVNAGFFTPEFQPLGLVISQGKKTGQWQRSTLLGGAVVVRSGRPMLLWRDEVQLGESITELVQAGPRLVNGGSIITGLDDARSRVRTFIATDNAGHWAVGLCEYATLSGLATRLTLPGLISGLEIERALNFDGGRSSALWLRTADEKEISESESATVRNFLGIFPRK